MKTDNHSSSYFITGFKDLYHKHKFIKNFTNSKEPLYVDMLTK